LVLKDFGPCALRLHKRLLRENRIIENFAIFFTESSGSAASRLRPNSRAAAAQALEPTSVPRMLPVIPDKTPTRSWPLEAPISAPVSATIDTRGTGRLRVLAVGDEFTDCEQAGDERRRFKAQKSKPGSLEG